MAKMKPGEKIRVPLKPLRFSGICLDDSQERERLVAQLLPCPPADAPASVHAVYAEVVSALHNLPIEHLRVLSVHRQSDAYLAWAGILVRAVAHLAPEHQSVFLAPHP